MEDKNLSGKQEQANFIFDTTADLHRALAISSCYYGDSQSSLVTLYKETAKPIMFQNVEITEDVDLAVRDELLHSDIVLFSFTCDRKAEWGTSCLCNAIYKSSIDDATAQYIASFPEEENVPNLYSAPFQIGGVLFFSPYLARRWAFYNIESNSWKHVLLPEEAIPAESSQSAFGSVIDCDKYLLILPGIRGVFAKYDKESGEFSYYSNWYDRFKAYVANPELGLFSGYSTINGKVFLSSGQSNVITELEPNEMLFKYHEVGSRSGGYCCIAYHNNAFWLLQYHSDEDAWNESIVEWQINTGDVFEYADLPVEKMDHGAGRYFNVLYVVGEEIFVFPYHSKSMIRFDPLTKKMSKVKLYPEYDFFKRKSGFYSIWKDVAFPWVVRNAVTPYPWKAADLKSLFDNPVFYAQMPYDYSLMTLNLNTCEYEIKKWNVVGAEDLLKNKDNSIAENIWTENELNMLDGFLKDLVNEKMESEPEKVSAVNSSAGQKIYSYVKGLVT